MNNRKITDLGPLQLTGIALVVSVISAVAVLLATRRRLDASRTLTSTPGRALMDTSGADRIPPQHEVDTAMPSQVPNHFSENLIVPGITETGADVERDDDTLGRSPEGV
jgi:hypothetical protein